MRLKLSQSIPWSQEELGGFAISAVLSAALFGVMALICGGPKPFFMGLGALLAILLLNVSPFKKLPGFIQFLACCAAAAYINRHNEDLGGSAFSLIAASIAYGFVFFAVFRVNWWVWWDYPSRRTIGQRMAASIFFTGIPFLGLGLGVWRLVLGIGQHDVTTQFIVDQATPNAKPLETIIEDPALAEHARRMEAIRAARTGMGVGRVAPADKAQASGSI
jgi:hypothetical protein